MRISDWSSDVCSSDLVTRGQPKRNSLLDALPFLHIPVNRIPGHAQHVDLLLVAAHRTGTPPIANTVMRVEPARRASPPCQARLRSRSEAHTSELQSLMRISYAVFCLKKTKTTRHKMNADNNKT